MAAAQKKGPASAPTLPSHGPIHNPPQDQKMNTHDYTAGAPASASPYQMTAQERLDFHAKEFAKAAKELDPTAEELMIGKAVCDLPGGYRFAAIVSAKQEARS